MIFGLIILKQILIIQIIPSQVSHLTLPHFNNSRVIEFRIYRIKSSFVIVLPKSSPLWYPWEPDLSTEEGVCLLVNYYNYMDPSERHIGLNNRLVGDRLRHICEYELPNPDCPGKLKNVS